MSFLCLFHYLELYILDRILFWAKSLFFQFPIPFVLHTQVFSRKFLKSHIPRNRCSNIVSGTESDVLVHLLVIHFWKYQFSVRHNSVLIDPGLQSKAKNILSGNRCEVKDTVKLMKIEFGEIEKGATSNEEAWTLLALQSNLYQINLICRNKFR